MTHRLSLILAGLFLFGGCEQTTSSKDPSSDAMGSAPMDNDAITDSPSEKSGWTPAPLTPQIVEESNAPSASSTKASRATSADQSDLEKLQGTWGAVTYVQDGQGEGEAPIAPEDSAIRFVFKGTDFLLLASGNAGATPKGSFKLGSSEKTKTIDLIFQAASNAESVRTMLGVYEIDGDTLKITYGPDGVIRPSDFKSAAGSNHIAIVFKRIRE